MEVPTVSIIFVKQIWQISVKTVHTLIKLFSDSLSICTLSVALDRNLLKSYYIYFFNMHMCILLIFSKRRQCESSERSQHIECWPHEAVPQDWEDKQHSEGNQFVLCWKILLLLWVDLNQITCWHWSNMTVVVVLFSSSELTEQIIQLDSLQGLFHPFFTSN